jgi:hypothetical protein
LAELKIAPWSHLPESTLETTGGTQTLSLYEKDCLPVQEIMLFPFFVVSIKQENSGLSDSNFAPSGMESAV